MSDVRSLFRLCGKFGLALSCESTGLAPLFRALRGHVAGPRIHVLGYHRVVDRMPHRGPVNPSLCITADSFRRQMQQLRSQFLLLPLSQVVKALVGELPLRRDAVAITFDDGYRDVCLRAAPVLAELAIPATVFIPTGFAAATGRARLLPHDRLFAALWAAGQRGLELPRLGDSETTLLLSRAARAMSQGGPAAAVEELIRTTPAAPLLRTIETLEEAAGAPTLDEGAEVLTPDEVRALSNEGWEVGAHTIGHVVLTHEPPAEVWRQLVESKAELERWSGRPCRYFAYCNGYHSPSLVRALTRAGYEGAVTTCDRPNLAGRGDRFRISRKVLWESHVRGPRGRFSRALSQAHLHDTFGALRLTVAVDGAVPQGDKDEPHGQSTPEVELAH